jgi:uncharacterized protein (TIGR02246 family)
MEVVLTRWIARFQKSYERREEEGAMKNILAIGLGVFIVATIISANEVVAQESTSQKVVGTKSKGGILEQKKIEQLLAKYEQALNQSSTEAVLPLYTKDGVFLPAEAPTAEGTAQIKASYDHVFSTIKPEIKFDIEEVVVSGDYAFAKTLSRGKATVLESNITQPEENRELFIFRKDAGEWKIARYMFNKSKPSSK